MLFAKCLLSGFYCIRYVKSGNLGNPGKEVCWTGWHFAMLSASIFVLHWLVHMCVPLCQERDHTTGVKQAPFLQAVL